MIRRAKILSMAIVCLSAQAWGCDETDSYNDGADAGPSATEDEISPVCVDGNGADAGSSETEDEISSVCADGVWVFEYAPDWGMDAAMWGEAKIVNGCLVLGQIVVVWHSDNMDEVRDLAARVLSGEKPTIALGGGYAQEVPSVIEERCSPVTNVFYGSSNPITVE
jgi:hypothetical protein